MQSNYQETPRCSTMAQWIVRFINLWRLHPREALILLTYYAKILTKRPFSKKEERLSGWYRALIIMSGRTEWRTRISRKITFRVGGRRDKIFVEVRPNTSDYGVFRQMFVREELRNVAGLLHSLNTAPLRIIDAGANVGMASVFLKAEFPDCEIVSIEPDPNNFSVMQRAINDNRYENVNAIPGALLDRTCNVSCSSSSGNEEEWSYTVSANPEGNILAYTLYDIVKMADWDRVDLLKIDVEGAEFAILEDLRTFSLICDAVRICAVEFHGHVASSRKIIERFRDHGFEVSQSGEYTVFYNQGLNV